jgi:hypothetical protein
MNRVKIVVLLVGYSLVVAGSALIYHPAGFLVAGTGMIFAALARKKVNE